MLLRLEMPRFRLKRPHTRQLTGVTTQGYHLYLLLPRARFRA